MRIQTQVAPLGQFIANRQVEIFTKAGIAEAIAESKTRKIPVYWGFPNHPDFQHKYLDTKPAGELVELLLTDFGMEAVLDINESSIAKLQAGCYYSADFGCFRSVSGGFEFFRLVSIGLTDNPTLPIKQIKT